MMCTAAGCVDETNLWHVSRSIPKVGQADNMQVEEAAGHQIASLMLIQIYARLCSQDKSKKQKKDRPQKIKERPLEPARV